MEEVTEGDGSTADPWSLFNPLTGFVQFLQYYYQSGCLYRLRALGERHNMDLTVGKLCVFTRGSSFRILRTGSQILLL